LLNLFDERKIDIFLFERNRILSVKVIFYFYDNFDRLKSDGKPVKTADCRLNQRKNRLFYWQSALFTDIPPLLNPPKILFKSGGKSVKMADCW
jgi:hypothetical protein